MNYDIITRPDLRIIVQLVTGAWHRYEIDYNLLINTTVLLFEEYKPDCIERAGKKEAGMLSAFTAERFFF